MCQHRSWNKLYSEYVEVSQESCTISMIAERNDYEIFKVRVQLASSDNYVDHANKIKKGFELLESYRNCDCTAKTGECIKHTTQINTNIPHLGGQIQKFNLKGKIV